MYLDIDLDPEDVLDQLPPEELAQALQLRSNGYYLGRLLQELYRIQGLSGGKKWEEGFRKGVEPEHRNELIWVHAMLNKDLGKKGVDKEIKKLVDKFHADVTARIEELY